MSKKRRTSKPEKRMSVGIPLPCGEYMIFNNLTEEDAKAIIEAGKDYYRKQYGVPESAFSLRGGTMQLILPITPEIQARIDRENATKQAAIAQLKALGYTEGDKVYFACIAHKKMPMDARLKAGLAWIPPGKKSPVPITPMGYFIYSESGDGKLYREYSDGKQPKSYSNALIQLGNWNRAGYGIYIRPNSGGHEDKDIEKCFTLFHEFDGISKDEQWAKVAELTALGFEPSLIIETRNSLHIYHRTYESEVEGWRELQQRLIQHRGSDPAIHNESRLMRLAGYKHKQWDEVEQWLESFSVEIKSITENIYSRTQFDTLLPSLDLKWEEKERKTKEFKEKATKARVSGNSTPNPIADAWDIRSFCHHFDGYHEMRGGWGAARCPNHNGQGITSFRVNLETGHFKCWAGCNGKNIFKSGVELAKARGHEFPEKDYQKAKADWKEEYEQKRKEAAKFVFTREPNIKVDSGYLPDIKLTDISHGIIGLKGSWGIGKSHLIGSWAHDWSHQKIQIAHLNSLLENTAPRFDLMHHGEVKDLNLPLNGCPNLAITDVSLAAMLNIETYQDEPFMLILDEIEQVIKSLVSSSNLRGNLRLQARLKVEWLIKNATYIIASDADLSDDTLEYLENIRGSKAFIIQHTGKPGIGRLPIKINANKGEVIDKLFTDIKAGNKVIFPTETKADLIAFEEALGIANDKDLLTIHGDNSAIPEIKKIIQEIDKLYTEYKHLGYTGTLGTGIDLSKPHFEKRYGIFTGDVFSATEQCQLLFRYRPDIPTEIFINARQRTLEIDPDQLIIKLLKKESDSATLLADNIGDLIEAGLYPQPNGEIDDSSKPFLKLWATIKARKNASMANPYQSLCDRLEESGFTLEKVDLDLEDEAKFKAVEDSHKDRKRENREAKDQAIAQAELLNDREYEEALRQKGSLSLEKRHQIEKTQLNKTLGIEITPDIVELERKRNLSSGIRLLHILLADDELATAYEMKDREVNPIITDRNHYLMKRNLLQKLEIPKFLETLQEPGFEYDKDTIIIQEIAKISRNSAIDIKTYLGITIIFEKADGQFKQSEVEIVNRILGKLGVLINDRKNKNKRSYILNQPHWELVQKILTHMDRCKLPQKDDYVQKEEIPISLEKGIDLDSLRGGSTTFGYIHNKKVVEPLKIHSHTPASNSGGDDRQLSIFTQPEPKEMEGSTTFVYIHNKKVVEPPITTHTTQLTNSGCVVAEAKMEPLQVTTSQPEPIFPAVGCEATFEEGGQVIRVLLTRKRGTGLWDYERCDGIKDLYPYMGIWRLKPA